MKYLMINRPFQMSHNITSTMGRTQLIKGMLFTRTEILKLIAMYTSHKIKEDILQEYINEGFIVHVNLKPQQIWKLPRLQYNTPGVNRFLKPIGTVIVFSQSINNIIIHNQNEKTK